jgi:hypothetical protein
LETVYRDFAPKGVKFFYIYKALAHPEKDGYVQPFTLQERLAHVHEAQRKLGTEITWIADSMDNQIKHAFGDRPNSEFVFDANGESISARDWSDPEALRELLEKRLGKINNPTRIQDLDLPNSFDQSKPAASGIVPRLEIPEGLRAIKVEPKMGLNPFYVKLRAEADSALFDYGKGQMYLGFHLDPIYRVHWNNLVDPIEYEVRTPEGILVSPAKGKGPKVTEASDIDPREFLVEIDRCESEGPLTLTVRYFGCNDEEGWCKPVKQDYLIYFEVDKDAGNPRRGGRRPGFGRQGRGGFGPGPGGRSRRGRGQF